MIRSEISRRSRLEDARGVLLLLFVSMNLVTHVGNNGEVACQIDVVLFR